MSGKHKVDYLSAFLYALMRLPSGRRTDIGVARVFIQVFRIALPPWADEQALCFKSRLVFPLCHLARYLFRRFPRRNIANIYLCAVHILIKRQPLAASLKDIRASYPALYI